MCENTDYTPIFTGEQIGTDIQLVYNSNPFVPSANKGIAISLRSDYSPESIFTWSLNVSTGLPIDPSHGEISITNDALGVIKIVIPKEITSVMPPNQLYGIGVKLFLINDDIRDNFAPSQFKVFDSPNKNISL